MSFFLGRRPQQHPPHTVHPRTPTTAAITYSTFLTATGHRRDERCLAYSPCALHGVFLQARYTAVQLIICGTTAAAEREKKCNEPRAIARDYDYEYSMFFSRHCSMPSLGSSRPTAPHPTPANSYETMIRHLVLVWLGDQRASTMLSCFPSSLPKPRTKKPKVERPVKFPTSPWSIVHVVEHSRQSTRSVSTSHLLSGPVLIAALVMR